MTTYMAIISIFFVMKNKKNKDVFKKIKNSSALLDPPEKFEIAIENPVLHKTQNELSEGCFYEVPDMEADMPIIAAKLMRNRKHYLNELEKNAREETIRHLIEINKKQIKNSVEKSEVSQDILEIMKKRHKWKSSFYSYDNSLPRICKVETCSNVALGQSDFCFNHITKDPSNRLFIECPNCHRIHAINKPCIV